MATSTEAAVEWTTLSRDDLGHLYSPSCWSKKLSADAVVNNHVKVIAGGAHNYDNLVVG